MASRVVFPRPQKAWQIRYSQSLCLNAARGMRSHFATQMDWHSRMDVQVGNRFQEQQTPMPGFSLRKSCQRQLEKATSGVGILFRNSKTIGLEWISSQVMRRTHSSRMNELKIDPKIVAEQLDQTVGVNPNVYTLASLSRRKEAVNVLEFAVRTSKKVYWSTNGVQEPLDSSRQLRAGRSADRALASSCRRPFLLLVYSADVKQPGSDCPTARVCEINNFESARCMIDLNPPSHNSAVDSEANTCTNWKDIDGVFAVALAEKDNRENGVRPLEPYF